METYYTLQIIGRVLFGAYFIYNGINHFKNHEGLTSYAAAKGVPHPGIAVYVTGLLLLLGGVGVAFNLSLRLALFFLALFLIPVTFKMHAFWNVSDPQAKMSEQIQFTKNLALLGAVFALM